MKNLLIVYLVVTLTGCAIGGKKTETDIYQEALVTASTSSGQVMKNIFTVEIPRHGLIADQVVIGLSGGANATYLREVLTKLKKSPERSILITGTSPSLNYSVMSNAMKGMDLSGIHIIYSTQSAKYENVKQAVEQTGAQFSFISGKK